MSTKKHSLTKISAFTLGMLIVSSIDNVRNLPSIALFGQTLPVFFVLATVFFLLPTSLVAAQLAITYPGDGGIYAWTKTAFGKRVACIAIWLQWVNTLVWFPTILLFIAATGSYLLFPHLLHNRVILLGVCILIFWIVTLVNLTGLKTAAWFATICSVFGMILPMSLIIILGILWMLGHHHSQLHITWQNAWPSFHHPSSWLSLTAIMAGFLGIELANVHARDLVQPARRFPRALGIAIPILFATMMFGALAIACVIPGKQISLVAGIMQALNTLLATYHLQGWLPVLSGLIVLGSIGKLTNWMLAPAKGLLQAAEDHFLPPVFSVCNKHNIPARILLCQALLVSLVSAAMLLMPTLNSSYWLPTALSTQLYLIMYVILFVAAWHLGHPKRNTQWPLSKTWRRWQCVCVLGLFGTLVSLIVGFIPPDNIQTGGAVHYEIIFCLGLVIFLCPLWGLLIYQQKQS